MKTLNLVDIDNSDIKYQISEFPDGQQNIVIDKNSLKYITPHGFKTEWDFKFAQIKSRLNNWLDLELITCSIASLRELGAKEIHLYVPYFLGARSDRKFEEGSNNYLKDVICPIINSLGLNSVTVLDPHSYVLEACLNNFKKIDNESVVSFAFNNLEYSNKQKEFINNCILVSPDAGASHKIYKLAEQIGYKGDIITCSKERDSDGKLSKCIVPNFDWSKDVIIVDDILDAGGTFINIAKTIITKREFSSSVHPSTYGKIYLIVTHGIFSKGFGELQQYFEAIYTTNSYQQLEPDTQVFVKQLNIF